MGIWKCFILIVLLAGVASGANAGEPNDDDTLTPNAKINANEKAEAIAYFRNGVQCFDEKEFQCALNAFEKAYELNPSWKLFYNIAHCQAALKMYGLAVMTFEKYLAEGGDAVAESRRDEVLAELERMRKMIGDIDIVAPQGVDVFVDDIHRGVTPLPGPVSVTAGMLHQIVLKQNGEVIFSAEKIVRGETTSEILYEPRATLPPVEPEKPQKPEIIKPEVTSPAPVADGRKKLSPVPFWVATGTTILLGGATVTLAVLINNGKSNMASDSDADTLNTMRKVGMGTLFGTAGAGITAIILAAFTDFKGSRKSAISFYGTPTQGGLMVAGSF